MSTTFLNRIVLILCGVGLFIAGSLSLSHVMDISIPCGVGSGCAEITNSPYAFFLGQPLAYFGFAGYAFLALLTWLRMQFGERFLALTFYLAYAGSLIGMLASFYLTYLSFWQLHAICTWCLSSALTATLLFVVHAILIAKENLEAPAWTQKDFMTLTSVFFAVLLGLGMSAVTLKIRSTKPVINYEMLKGTSLKDLIPQDAHILGDPNAPLTIVEFGDLLCPSCRRCFRKLEPMVKKNSKQVRLVFRHRPMQELPGHEMAVQVAVLSEVAAEQGRFWEYLHEAYETLGQYDPVDKDDLTSFGKRFGLPQEAILNTLAGRESPASNRVKNDLIYARKLKILETPTFILLAPGQEMTAVSAEAVFNELEKPRYKKYFR